MAAHSWILVCGDDLKSAPPDGMWKRKEVLILVDIHQAEMQKGEEERHMSKARCISMFVCCKAATLLTPHTSLSKAATLLTPHTSLSSKAG